VHDSDNSAFEVAEGFFKAAARGDVEVVDGFVHRATQVSYPDFSLGVDDASWRRVLG
jgi:hypothetical protein